MSTPTLSPAAAALNEAFTRDPQAIHALLVNRVPCNMALGDDPFVIVEPNQVIDGGWTVGTLGVVNAVLAANGQPLVAAKFSIPKNGEKALLLGFCDYIPQNNGVNGT
jgi:hypothetical protein